MVTDKLVGYFKEVPGDGTYARLVQILADTLCDFGYNVTFNGAEYVLQDLARRARERNITTKLLTTTLIEDKLMEE